MLKKLKISEARKRLFDLVDEVIGDDDEVVVIEHRDRPRRAVLVSEEHLRRLNATIAALRKRTGDEFQLAGSMKLGVSEQELEAALERSRARHRERSERKFGSL